MGKSGNKIFLLKLQIVKIIFYPIIVFLDKVGLISLFYTPIEVFVRFLGIKRSINSFLQYRDFTNLFKNDFNDLQSSAGIVLFPSFLGANSNFTMINLLFAKYYKAKGFKPVLVVCNSTVKLCQKENIIRKRKFNPLFCYECWGGFKYISKETGIPVIYLSDLIDRPEQERIDNINNQITKFNSLNDCENFYLGDIPIGNMVMKSVLRYLLKGKITGTPEEILLYKRFLMATIKLSIIYDKIFKQEHQIKKVIIHNGTLAFEALISHHCKRNMLPFMTYETYMGDNTLIYKKNDEVMKFEYEEEMKQFDYKTLPFEEMERNVKQFFEELKVGKHKYAILNRQQQNSNFKRLGRYACAFTNLSFDTSVIGRHTLFNDMEDWLVTLIDYWEQNENGIKLVIRVHPAEIKLRTATSEFMGNKLKHKIKSGKIVLIDSDETVNAYDLIDNMEYGLIYSSTIGLEIANMNKICIVAGKPFFRNKPFVITPVDKFEYFKILRKINSEQFCFVPDKLELVKWVYYLFIIRLKSLKGIKIYSLNAEKISKYTNSDEMLENNIRFFDDFESEFSGLLN